MSTESDGVADSARELRAAISRLEERLTRLEGRLGALETPTAQPVHAAPPPIQPTAPSIAPPRVPVTPPPIPQPTRPLELPMNLRPRTVMPAAKIMPARPRSGESLESLVGKSWASWVGGLLVLAAVLFFLQYAWSQGWIHPTPTMRIAAAIVVGVALIGVGEWMHFKKMKALAASLTGTGLAVIMAALFAAAVAFSPPVLAVTPTFVLVAIVGVIGIGLSLQMRAMSLTVLALVGMYLSPAILSTGEDHSLVLLVYLALVTATGLGVAFFKRKWLAVRLLCFFVGWLWVIAWSLRLSRGHGEMGIAAFAGFFALYLGEMVLSLLRVAGVPEDETAPEPATSPNTLRLESGAAVLSIANTAFAMCGFAIVHAQAGIGPLWMMALGLAGVMGILAFVTPSKNLTLSAGIQAMALVVVAVPLYFDRSAITFAWAILGLALAVYTYATNNKFARVWMLVMLLLVIGRLWTFDAFDRRLHRELFAVGSEHFTAWMMMSWGAAVYALGLGWLSARETVQAKGHAASVSLCAAAGTMVFAVASVAGLHSMFPLTLAVALWILALMAWSNFALPASQRALGETVALVLLVATTIKWALADGVMSSVVEPLRYDSMRGVLMPVANLFVLSGALLVAGILWSRSLRQGNVAARAWWSALLVFVALNVEAIRCVDYAHPSGVQPWILKNVIVSVLWGVLGLTGVLWGFRRKIASVRWVALVLLGATAAKVLLIDMANVETILRVLSFLALGVVLLLVSFVYHKVGAVVAGPAKETETVTKE